MKTATKASRRRNAPAEAPGEAAPMAAGTDGPVITADTGAVESGEPAPAPADPPPARRGATRGTPDLAKVEELTQRVGRKLFALTDRHHPSRISLESMQAFGMGLMMKDEELRYRLLRFVDVLPALRTHRAVAQHLVEYLNSPAITTGTPGTPLLATARRAAALGLRVPPVTDAACHFAVREMARQFIAGDSPETVARTIRDMEGRGFLFSLDLLGEFVASSRQADRFLARYIEMVEEFEGLLGPDRHGIGTSGPRVNISIKLSSLTHKFEVADPEGTSADVRARLRPLFRAAKKHGVFINIDMEKHESRDLTLRIIRDLLTEDEFRGFPHLGTVAQAYLADADVVLQSFLDWLEAARQPMTIRLVKGAYWDSEQLWARQKGWPVPVILRKRDTDAMYERCSRLLIERHDVVRTAIGSHNVRSIAHAIALAKAHRVPADRFECQMLFGMAGPIKEALGDMGVPVRIYTPCGDLLEGMAYLVRRILENTSNESFLRLRFAEGARADLLLADPKTPAPAM